MFSFVRMFQIPQSAEAVHHRVPVISPEARKGGSMPAKFQYAFIPISNVYQYSAHAFVELGFIIVLMTSDHNAPAASYKIGQKIRGAPLVLLFALPRSVHVTAARYLPGKRPGGFLVPLPREDRTRRPPGTQGLSLASQLNGHLAVVSTWGMVLPAIVTSAVRR